MNNYEGTLRIEKLTSLEEANQRRIRLSFAVNDAERAKILRDKERHGFYCISDYIRDRLVYSQKEGRRKLISEVIIELSELGQIVSEYQGDTSQLKRIVTEKITEIIKKID